MLIAHPSSSELAKVGKYCFRIVKDLFPICRSLTGDGVRQTLNYLRREIHGLTLHSVPSGTEAFDWVVPDEWFIRDGYIANESGARIVDFKENNLHVVGYSLPINLWLDLDALQKILHSIEELPDAIPYVTSYYSAYSGFCLAHDVRCKLKPGVYHAVIDSEIKPGQLDFADVVIPGESSKEVFLSTYICHPSMANNELSGPAVATALAQWLMTLPNRKYTYRIAFVPETIGSIVYINNNLLHLKRNVVAGFNITCIGDDRCYSFLPSRNGNTLSDRVALHVLKHLDPSFRKYTWLDRGSDERQYCAPGIDLPVATIMRSKYGEYREYHTSLDNLEFVTPTGLEGGYKALRQSISIIERNFIPTVTVLCEPQLGKRGLYPSISSVGSASCVKTMMDLISFCDGKNDLCSIADILGEPFDKLYSLITPLVNEGIIKASDVS